MKQEKSQLKTGVILGYINMLVGNLIPMFYTPVMLELLGQSEYGLYKLASSAASYLSLATFGIGSAVTRYLIKSRVEEGKEAEERIFGLFNIIFQIIAVITCVAGALIAINLDFFYSQSLTAPELQRMKLLVLILTVNTAIGFSASSYNAVVSSHERYLFLQIVNIITTCVSPILNIIVLYLGYASVGMTISSLILNIFVRIIYIIYVRRILDIRPSYQNIPTNLVKDILSFSFWVFLSTIVSQLYNSTDTMIIGAIPELATVGVAIYNIGGVFNNMVFSLAQAVSSLFTPSANRLAFSGASNTELTDFCIRIGRYQCYIISLACSGFVAFGRQFITWYVGADYMDAYWVAILMIIPSCIPLVQSAALSIIQAQNKHQFRSIIYLIIALINVVGTYILVHSLGIVGAALVTGLSTIAGQGIAMNWYYWKRIKLEIPRFWINIIQIIWIPVLMCIATILVSHFIDFSNIFIFFTGVAVYTVIYFILCWIFAMNSSEKENIGGTLLAKIRHLKYKT